MRLNLKTVKGTINHPSISETNEAELLEILQNDSKIISVLFWKKLLGKKSKYNNI